MPRMNKKQLLKGVRFVAARMVGNSTVMYHRANGERIYRVRDVDLITVYPDGSMRFDTQGKMNEIHRRKINQLQNFIKIELKGRKWHVSHAADMSAWRRPLNPFFDGLRVDCCGNIA